MAVALTQEDMRRLEKTITIRERLIDLFKQNEVVNDPKALFGFINLMDSLDKTVINRAKVKIEEDNNKNVAGIQESMAAMLLGIHSNMNKKARATDTELIIPDSISSDAVEGQAIIGLDERTFEEFKS